MGSPQPNQTLPQALLQRKREEQQKRWRHHNLKIERSALESSRQLRAQNAWWEVFQKQANAVEFMQEYHALRKEMKTDTTHNGEKEEEPVRLFAYEYGSKGQRNFIATTYSNFWDKYYGMQPDQRHYYEVISEGLPCHLYFDLEFSISSNVDANGDNMVMVLTNYLISALAKAYGICVRTSDFVHLDSTSKTKFSRHLILRAECLQQQSTATATTATTANSTNNTTATAIATPSATSFTVNGSDFSFISETVTDRNVAAAASSSNTVQTDNNAELSSGSRDATTAVNNHSDDTVLTKTKNTMPPSTNKATSTKANFAFLTNIHAGNFVKKMCLDIERDQHHMPELQCLFINPEEKTNKLTSTETRKKLFIDQGVYSRNRCFRLFLSSKWGPNKPRLKPVLSLSASSACFKPTDSKTFLSSNNASNNVQASINRLVVAEKAEGVNDVQAYVRGNDAKSLDETETSDVEEIFFFKFESQRSYFFSSLICNVDSTSTMLTCEDVVQPQFSRKRPSDEVTTVSPTRYVPRSGSRFPCLDRFIASLPILHRGGQRGFVRKCVELESSSTQNEPATMDARQSITGVFCYTIGGNRWCGNVQRAHKSNSIYLVCDLQLGSVVQKCFDPDCRMYRALVTAVPQFVLSLICSEADDDALLLQLAEQVP